MGEASASGAVDFSSANDRLRNEGFGRRPNSVAGNRLQGSANLPRRDRVFVLVTMFENVRLDTLRLTARRNIRALSSSEIQFTYRFRRLPRL